MISEEDYSNGKIWKELTKGKSVALVGGSDKINWNRVNQCDLVARVNSHWERQRGRCDILYFSCGDDLSIDFLDDPELYDTLKFAWVNASNMLFNGDRQIAKYAEVCSLIRKRNVQMALYASGPPKAFETFDCLRNLGPRYRWTRDLARRWEFHPLTGMIALYHLGCAETSSVYVDGMDFYVQKDGTLPTTAGTHDIDSQLRFFREFTARSGGRIQVSETLSALLPN